MKKFITLTLALAMSISLVGCGGGNDSNSVSSDNASSSVADSSGIENEDGFTSEEIAADAPSDPTGDDGGLNTDDMTKDQIQDYIMSQSGWYDEGMSEDRFSLWVDYATNGWDMYHGTSSEYDIDDRYNTMSRQLYDNIDAKIVFEGNITFIDRTGSLGATTVMLIEDDGGNIYTAATNDQLSLISGDNVIIFGRIKGETTYTNTNAFGTATEYYCPLIEIDDYTMSLTRWTNRYDFTQYERHEGPVEMLDSQAEYYYGRSMRNVYDFSATTINEHPYETLYWYYDRVHARYFIYFYYYEYDYTNQDPSILVIDYTGMVILPPDPDRRYTDVEYVPIDTRSKIGWGDAISTTFGE